MELLSFIPVIIVSGVLGPWYGAAGAILLYAGSSLLMYLFDDSMPLSRVFFRNENIMGGLIIFLTGIFVGILRDLNARLQGELEESRRIGEALRKSEERYAPSAQGGNDGLWDWDLETGRMFYSTRWKEMIGCTEEEIFNSPDEFLSRIHPDDRAIVERLLGEIRNGDHETFSVEHRILHRKNYYLWVLLRGSSVKNDRGKIVRITGSLTDITEKTIRDPLTGLPNRLLLLESLDFELTQHRKTDGEYCFAALCIDIDNFSLINANFGPSAGDQVLRQAAERLRTSIRNGDPFGRTDADEFMVIVRNLGFQDDIGPIVERIRYGFLRPFTVQEKEMVLSVSIGIAKSSLQHTKGADLLRDANIALAQARRQGKGFSTIFNTSMPANVVSKMSLEDDIRLALERDEFELYYQPIARADTLQTVGAEALLRWKHRNHGIIEPERFLFILEKTGLIGRVGAWVIRTACAQAAEWKASGITGLYVSVNISALQLTDKNLPALVMEATDGSRLSPGDLVLEIAEPALEKQDDTVSDTFEALRNLGTRLSIDGFGTGGSSMRRIRLPAVESIKIDRSFVDGCSAKGKDRVIVSTMIELAGALGLETTAVGVETESILEVLRGNGCPLIQGYYLSPPLPAKAFALWYRSRSRIPETVRLK